MALKDITLGQYFPGTTLIHRLDPRSKLVLTLFYIVALFLAKRWLSYVILAAVLVVYIVLSRIKPKALFKGLRPILILIAFTAILNMLYTDGQVLWRWGILKITVEGLWSALFMVLRIVLLILCAFLLTYTTSPMMLTDGLENLLGFLKKIKVPIHELAMMMSIALRFIPTLIEEADKIMSAQKARGAEFDTGNLAQKCKALVPLLIPLFISAFRRADELATSMECRCYHGGEGRTRLHQLHYRAPDWIFMACALALCVGIGLLRWVFLL